MALNLNEKARNQGSAGGSFQSGSSENVAVEITGYNISDPKKKNTGVDYAEGKLLHDAFGLKEGTVIKFKKNPPKNVSADGYQPMDIWNMPRKEGSRNPISSGDYVILERSYMDSKDGFVKCNYISNALSKKAENDYVHIDVLSTVEREYEHKGSDGNSIYSQNRVIVLNEHAVKVESLDDFKDAVYSIIDVNKEQENMGPEFGRPGFIFRIASTQKENNYHSLSFRVNPYYKKETGSYQDGDAVIDYLLTESSGETNADKSREHKRSLIAELDNPENLSQYIFEVIPITVLRTGLLSLPSQKKKGKKDDHPDFTVPFEELQEVKFKTDGSPLETSAYAKSLVLAQGSANDPSNWFVTRTIKRSGGELLFVEAEIVTPNLPEEIAKLYTDRAKNRTESYINAQKAKYGSSNSAEKPSDDIPMDDSGEAPVMGLKAV